MGVTRFLGRGNATAIRMDFAAAMRVDDNHRQCYDLRFGQRINRGRSLELE